MKASKHLLSLVLLASLATACGGTSYQKDPAPDLSNEHQMTPDQAAQAQKDHDAQLEQKQKDTEADRDKWKRLADANQAKYEDAEKRKHDAEVKAAQTPTQVVVHDQVKVDSPSTTITSDYFTITLPDAEMIFHEGQKSSYQILAKSLVPGVKICLVSTDLPKGANFTSCSASSQPASYALEWTPAIGTVQSGSLLADVGVHFSIKIMSASGTSHDVNFYQGLVQAKPATLHVESVSQAPTDISVDAFPGQVTEGSQTQFTVTATVPGVDDKSANKPTIGWSAKVRVLPGTNYTEQSAFPFITTDIARRDPKYLGNYKWQFSLILDTKSVPVPAEKGVDGAAINDSTVSHFNIYFFVMNSANLSVSSNIQQVQIVRDLPAQPAPATTPTPAPKTTTSKTVKK